MLNIPSENSIDTMKKSNIVNKNIRIDDKVRNEIARNTVKSSNANSQIFKNDIINNNLSNSKTRDIHTRIKFSTRCSIRLIEIENWLNSVERSTNTTTFAAIDEVSIKKKWNAIKIEDIEIYTNDCNSENFLIVSLISRNRSFAISIFSK